MAYVMYEDWTRTKYPERGVRPVSGRRRKIRWLAERKARQNNRYSDTLYFFIKKVN
jgi:hypothetical protein